MISGFQTFSRPGRSCRGSNSQEKVPGRSQGRLANDCVWCAPQSDLQHAFSCETPKWNKYFQICLHFVMSASYQSPTGLIIVAISGLIP
ncbi:hypothetical protein PoB_006622400 [Plakobranchus ocellatus]|uniref:Uncharacterized protein n=1 Tax=Plakobranchus ocellatus TaxID=259542 RepID=A0AAV4D6D0_9GAST|nr:hypothetical protein PoB_006622400 [Plakobranchus ocellatus]